MQLPAWSRETESELRCDVCGSCGSPFLMSSNVSNAFAFPNIAGREGFVLLVLAQSFVYASRRELGGQTKLPLSRRRRTVHPATPRLGSFSLYSSPANTLAARSFGNGIASCRSLRTWRRNFG